MTRGLRWIGFLATAVIVALLALNILREPTRQRQALIAYHEAATTSGIDLYAANCARCHGAAGEGLGVYRALNQPFIADKSFHELEIIIQYGRYATEMAAFGLDEGGSLTSVQINDLVLMLQTAQWDVVQAHVEALGMTPTEEDILAAERTRVTIFEEADITTVLTDVLPIFVENCAECHGEQGEGTADAPQLNNAYVRGMSVAQLTETVSRGVRNTKMEGFDVRLSQETIAALVSLLSNWDQLDSGGDSETRNVIASEAEIASVTETGQQLFNTWCGVCHGTNGEGGAIAPSLNDIPYLPIDFLVSRIRNGQNAMPPFAETNLNNGQLAVVIDYTQSTVFGSGLPEFSPGELAQGQTLYTQQCAECHGESGEGVPDMGPRINTMPPMRASEIINFTRVGSAQTPAIPSNVVSDQELRLIVAFIHNLTHA